MNKDMGGQKYNSGGSQKGQNSNNNQRPAGTPMMLAPSKDQPLSSSWLYFAMIAGIVLLGSGWLISKHNAKVADGTDADTASEALDVLASVSESDAVSKESADEPAAPAAAATAPVVAASNGETVTIEDQPATSNVTISDMTLGKVSWVAVRETSSGRILGARRFEPGQKTGIVVLLRPTEAGTSYEGVVYVDDGDKEFDYKKDILVKGVSTSFKAL